MTFVLDSGSRDRPIIEETAEQNLDGSTVEMSVDGVWYPATWDGPSVKVYEWDGQTTQTRWRRVARTDTYFAGPAAPSGPGVVLAIGKHPTATRLRAGDQVLERDTQTMVVKA